MEGWHERGTLAAERHVSTPEITHDGEACVYRDQSGIAELDGGTGRRIWRVEHRLAMAPNSANGLAVVPDTGQEFARQGREFLGNAHVKGREFRECRPGRVARDAAEQFPKFGRVVSAPVGVNDAALIRESGENGVDAIHAGPGHETDVEVLVRQRSGLVGSGL